MADSTESQAVGRVTREGQDVSAGAQAALARAIAVLEPYVDDEPRLAAHVRQLNATRNPTDFSGDADADDDDGDGDEQLAKALIDVQQLAKSEDTPPALRERAEKAARDLQAAHLDRMGSGHGRVLESERERARLARGRAA